MFKDKIIEVLTATTIENYYNSIEKLNNIFSYKNLNIEEVFELSQKLCDDYIEGSIEKKEKIKVEESIQGKLVQVEKEIITYKNLSAEGKRLLVGQLLHTNSALFLRVLGDDLDTLGGLSLKEIGQKYLFSRWSMAEKTGVRRRKSRMQHPRELLQEQFQKTINHGQFHQALLYRAKKIKVCTVRYNKIWIHYETVKTTITERCGPHNGEWVYTGVGGKKHCDQFRSYMCDCGDWYIKYTQRNCCDKVYDTKTETIYRSVESYECQDASFWTLEMQALYCTYYRDEYMDYYNLCRVEGGHYLPVKQILRSSIRKTDVNWDERHNRILEAGDPADVYTDIYITNGNYFDEQNFGGTPNMPKTGCVALHLCGGVAAPTPGATYTDKNGATIQTYNLPPSTYKHETIYNPRPCWQKQ